MGFLADLLMYKIKRSDMMSDQDQRAADLAKIAGFGQQNNAELLGQSTAPIQDPFQRGIDTLLQKQPDPVEGLMSEGAMLKSGQVQPPSSMPSPDGGGGFFTPQQAWQLMQVPGYEQVAAGMLNQGFGQDAAMGRQQQQQQFELSPENTFQKMAMERMKAQIKASADLAKRKWEVMNDPSKLVNMENVFRDDYRVEVNPMKQVVDRYNSSTKMIDQAGGYDKLTGAQDVKLVRDYLKSILPNEAVMSDDQRAVAAARGLGGTIDQWSGILSGKSQLGEEGAMQIHQVMRGMADESGQAWSEANQKWGSRAAERNLSIGQIVTDVPVIKGYQEKTQSNKTKLPTDQKRRLRRIGD